MFKHTQRKERGGDRGTGGLRLTLSHHLAIRNFRKEKEREIGEKKGKYFILSKSKE